MKYRRISAWIIVLAGLLFARHGAAEPPTAPPAGLREFTPRVHALTNAQIVLRAGKVIERGTVVVRDGVIAAVGKDVLTPADARIWDCRGKTIYPAFIDLYSELPLSTTESQDVPGPAYWNNKVTPQRNAAGVYQRDAELNTKLRRQGFAVRLVAPADHIVKGTSALVHTGDGDSTEAVIVPLVAMHARLDPPRPRKNKDDYPTSPMGAMTLVRQSLHDARWHASAWKAFHEEPGRTRPEQSAALAALEPVVRKQLPLIIDAADWLYFLRADQVGREFNLPIIIRGGGDEYQRLDEIAATKRPVIVPLNFPLPPDVRTPEKARDASLERLMHWDIAPENPGRLDQAGVPIALTAHGLKDPAEFLKSLRQAIARGLSPDAALRALTETPAKLLELEDRLGVIEAGHAAHMIVTDGELFGDDTRIIETWVDGDRYPHEPEESPDPRGRWKLEIVKPGDKQDGGDVVTWELRVAGERGKLTGELRQGAERLKAEGVSQHGHQLGVWFDGEKMGVKGLIRLSITVLPPEDGSEGYEAPGTVVWPDDVATTARGVHQGSIKQEDEKPTADDQGKEKDDKNGDVDKQPKNLPALFAVNYPLGEFGAAREPEQPEFVAFEHATVWTEGPQGTLQDATVLVHLGKIVAVGRDVRIPPKAQRINARGKHITPGIIDCHSHIATDGGINEMGQTITAEVRIGDFIDPRDINIYRQLAGGVTAASILHGSANTIGGQTQVVKFRWGAMPEKMKFADAPPGVKFALGENPKQSNWGDQYKTRYPQTRMGVTELIRDAFRAAIDYRGRWIRWREKKEGPAPRVDLELEALAEVVFGRRLIHCHSYRQDEILATIRVCDEFNVRIATFQHVLEGYKVADAIAKHGAGGSSFSDWWTYKFEVYDAIPHNGAMMHHAGVVTSFNSDSAELARRLNTEAAKAVKYGHVKPEEALRFVTLHPAQQLRIDDRVGSLEVGKDADLVVWSGPPLSTLTRCEQTWVDGRRHFALDDDLQRRAENARRHAALVQRVLESGQESAAKEDESQRQWVNFDVLCGHCRGAMRQQEEAP